MSGITTIIGNRGEDVAVEWLRDRGFYLVQRNWRIGHYEIDIIAQRWDTLHFIEVKTRRFRGWQTPYDSIDERKLRSLRRAANAYRTMHHTRLNVQFDLIAITVDDHDHYSVEYTENIL